MAMEGRGLLMLKIGLSKRAWEKLFLEWRLKVRVAAHEKMETRNVNVQKSFSLGTLCCNPSRPSIQPSIIHYPTITMTLQLAFWSGPTLEHIWFHEASCETEGLLRIPCSISYVLA